MSKNGMSLYDILNPPVNQWLQGLAKRKSDLPLGVRIVRFSEDDGAELFDEAESKLRAQPKSLSLRQAA